MQTGLMVFELVANLNQVSVDIRSVSRQYGISEHQEVDKHTLIRIIQGFQFKARLKRLTIEVLCQKYPLPAIFITQAGGYGVLLKDNPDARRVLIYLPGAPGTQDISFEEWEALTTGEVIVLFPKGLSENARFGFQWFLAEILKYKQVIAEVLIGSFMIQLFALVTPLFTQVILDKVIVHNSVSTLNILVVGFVLISVFELLIQMTRNYIFGHTAGKIDAKLGAKLFRKLFSLPFVYFETRKVGDIISRVRELETVREFICNRAVSVVIDLFFSLVFVAMMLFYSVPLTLVVLAFVLVVGILYIASTPGFRDQLDEKFQMYAQSNSYLVESVTGVQTVKSLAIEGTLQRKWEDYLAKYLFSNFKLTHLSNVLGAVSQFLQKIMTIAMLYVGVTLVIQNQLTIGQLIAFQMFAGQFTTPVLRLVGLWQEFQQVLLAVDRLGDVLNHPIEVSSDKAITLPDIQGLVKFENISFKYSPESPMVLHQIGFEIQPGMCVGIVGRSGSGKSTVTKLIQRLYLPHEGAIFLDGIDVRHLNPTWLRSRIGVVLQESFLFSGTIRENISYPQPDAPIELIIEMAKLAGAHDFITQLPEGYETLVGERGSSLSGGQKQRIAIARALITNPKILIFDEATSALDYESDRIIQSNLRQIRKNRTTFVIAHRLSTIEDSDIILAFDKGKIVESGTHSQLLAQNGYYHYLYHQQEVISAS